MRMEVWWRFITNQYQQLLTSSAGMKFDEVLGCVDPIESHREEIWKALECISDLKAPGADGLPSIFYKKF